VITLGTGYPVAVSNSGERFKQHRMLEGSAIDDVTAVAVTPKGHPGRRRRCCAPRRQPAHRQLKILAADRGVLEQLSPTAGICPSFMIVAGISECVDLQRIWWHQLVSVVCTGQSVRR
jgi:hypothetical protein